MTDERTLPPTEPALPPGAATATGPRRRGEERARFGPPQFTHWELREPVHRLGQRWVEEPPPRPAPGDRLGVHPDAVRKLEPKEPVRPEPNAPLLKRIVRSPYGMGPAQVVRVTIREESPTAEPRQPLERPTAAYRELLADLTPKSPMRSSPHRPEPRPRPRLLPNSPRAAEGSFPEEGP